MKLLLSAHKVGLLQLLSSAFHSEGQELYIGYIMLTLCKSIGYFGCPNLALCHLTTQAHMSAKTSSLLHFSSSALGHLIDLFTLV